MSETDGTAKKKRPGFNAKMAFLVVLERQQKGWKIGYREIAQRFNISCTYLRELWKLYQKGLLDLGEPESAQEVEADSESMMQRTLKSANRYHKFLCGEFEGAILLAEEEASKGNAKKKIGQKPIHELVGAGKLMREIQAVLVFRTFVERGYSTLLQDQLARKDAEQRRAKAIDEKQSGPIVEAEVTETKVMGASEEQRAIQALLSTPLMPPTT